jgi:hypothetical protein
MSPPTGEHLSLGKRLLFSAIVALLGAAICEIGARLLLGELFDLESTQRTFEETGLMKPRFAVDPELGWTHVKDAVVAGEAEGRVHLDADGLRISHLEIADPAPEVLAVGDSITFGDGVKDDETWPARLESLRGRRVLNAGVSGYGLDQAVLRAERLLARHRVDWVVLTFIPDDVSRSTHSRQFGLPKPVFVPRGDRFVLTPPRLQIGRARLRHLLGYSRAVSILMRSLGVASWQGPGSDNVVAHEAGVGVARYLLDRFVDRVGRAGARPLLVYLYYPGYAPEVLQHPGRLDPLLTHLRESGIPFLDAGQLHVAAVARDPSLRRRLYGVGWHFSPKGNRWFAAVVNDALREEAEKDRRRAARHNGDGGGWRRSPTTPQR